jgi:hypothetical protein
MSWRPGAAYNLAALREQQNSARIISPVSPVELNTGLPTW